MQEALYAAYTPGERDYNAIVSRMKGAGIDVIYIGGYHTEAGLILRQAKEQGMNVTLIGGDALVTNEFWQISGAAGEGTLMTFSSDPRRRPQAAEVVQRFRAKNIDPEGYVLYTYAAIQIWAQAADKIKNLDPRQIAAALKAQGPWQTVLGDDRLRPQGRRDGAGLRLLRLEERQLQPDVGLANRRRGSHLPRHRQQQLKGGDPVSHCLKAGAAVAAWIIAPATAGAAS